MGRLILYVCADVCQLNQNWQMSHVLHYFYRIAPKLFSFLLVSAPAQATVPGGELRDCFSICRFRKSLFPLRKKSSKFNNLFFFDYPLALNNYFGTNLNLMIFALGPQNKQITSNNFGTNFWLNSVNAKTDTRATNTARALVKMQQTKVVELAKPEMPNKLPLFLMLLLIFLFAVKVDVAVAVAIAVAVAVAVAKV